MSCLSDVLKSVKRNPDDMAGLEEVENLVFVSS
jgi:hypothetical protein